MAGQPIPPIAQPYITPAGSKKAQILAATALNVAEMQAGVEKLTKTDFLPSQDNGIVFPLGLNRRD